MHLFIIYLFTFQKPCKSSGPNSDVGVVHADFIVAVYRGFGCRGQWGGKAMPAAPAVVKIKRKESRNTMMSKALTSGRRV